MSLKRITEMIILIVTLNQVSCGIDVSRCQLYNPTTPRPTWTEIKSNMSSLHRNLQIIRSAYHEKGLNEADCDDTTCGDRIEGFSIKINYSILWYAKTHCRHNEASPNSSTTQEMFNILHGYHTALGNMINDTHAPIGLYKTWANLSKLICSVVQFGNLTTTPETYISGSATLTHNVSELKYHIGNMEDEFPCTQNQGRRKRLIERLQLGY